MLATGGGSGVFAGKITGVLVIDGEGVFESSIGAVAVFSGGEYVFEAGGLFSFCQGLPRLQVQPRTIRLTMLRAIKPFVLFSLPTKN